MKTRTTVLVLVLIATIASEATAQDDTQSGTYPVRLVAPGQQVRVSSLPYTGIATVVHVKADTLVLVEGLASEVPVPLSAITSLEIHRRATVVERALRGARWGAIVGGGLGIPAILVADSGPNDPPRITWPFIMAAVYAPVGALIGLPIPQHRWQRVALPERTSLEDNL